LVGGIVPFDQSSGGNKHARNVTFPPNHVICGYCSAVHFQNLNLKKNSYNWTQKSDPIVPTKIDDIRGL
jgi:hypothetical protein